MVPLRELDSVSILPYCPAPSGQSLVEQFIRHVLNRYQQRFPVELGQASPPKSLHEWLEGVTHLPEINRRTEPMVLRCRGGYDGACFHVLVSEMSSWWESAMIALVGLV